MSVEIVEQPTPNPHAMKYVLSQDVVSEGKVTFNDVDDCEHVPLAGALFELPNVTQVHFFENVITVTQEGYGSVGEPVFETIRNHIAEHNPDFNKVAEAARAAERESLDPDLRKIEDILDEKIRPALQMDGGDLDVVNYDKESHQLLVSYQGACGSCPSATAGTLMAIQGILRDEFDSEIEVMPGAAGAPFAF